MPACLLNVAVPLFIFEWWYVLLAFVAIVLIESLVLCKCLQCKFLNVAVWVFKANLTSTLGGYIAQSLIRFFTGLILFLTIDVGADNGIADSLTGNIGVGQYEGGWMNPMILFNFIVAVTCCFVLSVIIEGKLIERYAERKFPVRKLSLGVVIANIISYAFLFSWLLWNYERVISK